MSGLWESLSWLLALARAGASYVQEDDAFCGAEYTWVGLRGMRTNG